MIAHAVDKNRSMFESRPALPQTLNLLLPSGPSANEIIGLWLPHAEYSLRAGGAHQDINEVMLATAIVPNTFLSVGERHQIAAN